jgi:nitrite reductase/ring-hydroxylating ferredoxin subunit
MSEHDHDLTLPGHCPRRTVLRGAVALGAAGVLAGCGGSSSDSAAVRGPAGADTGGATSATPTPTESSPSPSASASESSSSSSGGGRALGPASDIPVGGGKIYDAQKIVVTQPTAGTYKAFSAVCTHEQCTVSDLDDGTINCPCHGSKFSLTDGSVVHGPAEEPLPAKNVTVSGGNVSVTA